VLFLNYESKRIIYDYNLCRNNVGYASTCNTSGQIIGVMIGSVFSILFTSEDFSNKYLRVTIGIGGIISLKCK